MWFRLLLGRYVLYMWVAVIGVTAFLWTTSFGLKYVWLTSCITRYNVVVLWFTALTGKIFVQCWIDMTSLVWYFLDPHQEPVPITCYFWIWAGLGQFSVTLVEKLNDEKKRINCLKHRLEHLLQFAYFHSSSSTSINE